MTDTNVSKSGQLENTDETNNVGDISANSKESDVENVDAIKKYIKEQEQEILLNNPSPANDLETSIETQNPVETAQSECELLQHQQALTGNSDATTKTFQKQTVALSPNKTKTVIENQEQLVHSKEANNSQSQTSFVNDSKSDLVKEDNCVNQAETTLSLENQSVTNMQTNTNKLEQVDVIQHSEKNNDDIIEMSINNKSEDLKKCEMKFEESRTSDSSNQPIDHKLDSSENKDKLKLKCTMVSDFETQGSEYTEGPKLLQQLLTSSNTLDSKMKKSEEFKCEKLNVNEHTDETLAIATSVIDMILTDTETAINKKNVCNVISKQFLSPEKVNSSVSLAIGSKVEAKDFAELWYPAEIIEVDCEEMEVLVQYDNQPKKHNEWISISSPRLRPINSCEPKLTLPTTPSTVNTPEHIPETKTMDKQKVTFAVGERCLARWRDNRRFIATIQNDLGGGSYEVMFDDGFQWKCTLSRLYKLKESSKYDYTSLNTSMCPSPAASPAALEPAAAPPAPPARPGPAAPADPTGPPTLAAPAVPPFATNGLPLIPAYHTHLFDPTRDYLGSKSERREMKRKLNIKEIFNIGQKRKKLPTVDKETKRAFVSTKQVESAAPETTHRPASPEKPPVTINPPVKTNSALEIKHHAKKKAAVKKKPFMRKKIKLKTKRDVPFLNEVKNELPDAVAAIIGTFCKPEPDVDEAMDIDETAVIETKDSNANDIKPEEHVPGELANSMDTSHTLDSQHDVVIKEEIKTENFEIQDGVKHEEVIDKIKEVITKLEDGINKVEQNEVKPIEIKQQESEDVKPALESIEVVGKEKRKKSSKVKKGKKLRLMQEKKVKKQVEKVKCQLEEMKKQVEAMRKQILLKTEELASSRRGEGAGEGCLLPGEWACRWVDGQPAGPVSEVECDAPAAAHTKPPLPRRSVQVEDNRLPPGWTKHMVRRSLGHSAGKWDVVLVSPDNRRLHTKSDMRIYLENNPEEGRKPYEPALLDFGIHLKLARRLGWVASSAAGAPPPPPPTTLLDASSPLLKRRKLAKHRPRPRPRTRPRHDTNAKNRRELKIKLPPLPASCVAGNAAQNASASEVRPEQTMDDDTVLDGASITDGFVYVGSLKVQVIETLLRCPAEDCYKNFRNTTLLKMHIKHYHRELRKMMGATPKVLDLAYARTRPSEAEMKRLKCEAQQRIIKVKLPRLHKRTDEPKPEPKEIKIEPSLDLPPSTPPLPDESLPKRQDSPKLRNALVNKPPKRPKVLLPVRSAEPEIKSETDTLNDCLVKLEEPDAEEMIVKPKQEVPDCGVLDFESAISKYTLSRVAPGAVCATVAGERRRRRRFASIAADGSDEEWPASEPDTRSSLSCGTPDSRPADLADLADLADGLPSLADNTQLNKNNDYLFTENGERIKLVRMKREEIINCHCGFREEDGLMVQCELCLCWQHALCHNIQREAEVPEKYTCSICLNPRRGRRRQRFTHDQDRLYEGLLPAGGGGRTSEPLRRAHELAGNLLRAADALHAVRVNTHVATKKNHPKLYLWAKDWETVELTFAQEKLNSEYSDLNVIINNLGKENLPIRAGDIKETALDMKTPPSEEQEEKYSQKENQMESQALLSGLLSSPGGVSLDLPISESELEKLAKSVQAVQRAPQPEAAIEDGACRARLLRHVQRCHALLDQRLDSIEAQVAELESQDPSLEDDETADFYPRTKQTMHMMLRDLDTMEELGIVT